MEENIGEGHGLENGCEINQMCAYDLIMQDVCIQYP